MKTIPPLLYSFSLPALLAAFSGTSALVCKLFNRADSALSDEERSTFGAWLAKIKSPKEILNLPARFPELFDSVFGKKHLSWRCFFTSAVVSLSVSVILSIIFLSQNLPLLMAYKGYMGSNGFHWSSLFEMLSSYNELGNDINVVVFLKTFGIFLLFVNIPAGYLSLLQARRLFSFIEKFNKPLLTISFLIFNAVLNGLIFLFFLSIVFFVFFDAGGLPSFELAPEEYYYYIKSMILFSYHYDFTISSYTSLEASPAPFFYSTLFTSAWLSLFVMASAVIWSLKHLPWLTFVFRKFADLEKRPMQFLSIVSTWLFFLLYSIIALEYVIKTIT